MHITAPNARRVFGARECRGRQDHHEPHGHANSGGRIESRQASRSTAVESSVTLSGEMRPPTPTTMVKRATSNAAILMWSVYREQTDDFLDAPDGRLDPSSHRRDDAQCLVNLRKVAIASLGSPQSDGVHVVSERPAGGVQPVPRTAIGKLWVLIARNACRNAVDLTAPGP